MIAVIIIKSSCIEHKSASPLTLDHQGTLSNVVDIDSICYCAQEAQGALNESRSLRSKVQLAEQAQRQARGMEQDYEEVLRVLEQEVTELRNNQSNKDVVGVYCCRSVFKNFFVHSFCGMQSCFCDTV